GFDANQARRHLLKERQNKATLELTADHHMSFRIDAVNPKDRLCDVETNCCDRMHVWLLRIVGALAAPTSMALTCRWRSRPQHQVRMVSLYNRAVNEPLFAELSAWLTQAGLAGASETDILSGFCERCVTAGFPL